MANGIELAMVMPGFVGHFDIGDLLAAVFLRKLLIMAADQDQFTTDSQTIYEKIKTIFESLISFL